MPIRKKKNANQAKKLIQALRKIDNKKIKVGHFASDGEHSKDLSYVELMQLWAFGGPNQDSVKNPKAILGIRMKELSSSLEFRKSMMKWSSGRNPADLTFMSDLGSFILNEYKILFGEVHPSLMQGSPTNPNSPLLDSGKLRDKANYKIT
jgi:hypothetical protein